MRTVHSLVHWFCAQLTRSELVEAVALLQEVVAGRRDDIRLKKEFHKQHPNYRRYTVDTTPPLTDPPEQRLSACTLDWRELLDRYKLEKGRALAPIIPHGGRRPPAGSRCEGWEPERFRARVRVWRRARCIGFSERDPNWGGSLCNPLGLNGGGDS